MSTDISADLTVRRTLILRMVASITMTAIVAVFVHLYSLQHGNVMEHGYKFHASNLPLPTLFFRRYSMLGFLIPFIVPSIWLHRGRFGLVRERFAIEVSMTVAEALSLLWLFGCLLAWQLPFYIPIGVID